MVRIVGLALLYLLAAQGVVALPLDPEATARVWPSAGVALAALLLYGPGLWPGVFLGALGAALLTGSLPGVAVGYAAAAVVEALLGVVLLRRVWEFRTALERTRDVVGLVALGALAAPMAGALLGALVLSGGAGGDFGTEWWSWWIGSAIGVMVVAPLLLTFGSRSRFPLPASLAWEGALVLALLVVAGSVAFMDWPSPFVERYTLAYLPFPPVAWAAVRFGPRGAAAAAFLATGLAVWGTAAGVGSFAVLAEGEGLVQVWLFMNFLGLTAMLLAGLSAERREAEEGLRAEEERYRLLAANASDVIARLAPDGTVVDLSGPTERILGLQRRALLGRSLYDLIHLDDLARVGESHREILQDGGMALLEFRTREGEEAPRWLESTTAVVRRPRPGVHEELVAVFRDVTPRKEAEAAVLARVERQAALAEFGRVVLSSPETPPVMAAAAELLHRALDVDGSGVFERGELGGPLLLRAGVGWPPGEAGALRIGPPELRDSGGLVGGGEGPLPAVLRSVGANSGLTMAIPGREGPLGALAVFTRLRRDFSEDEANFLRAVAHLLGSALERRILQEDLLHSRKLEAVGVLAGGVAHDFNNLLTAILGYASGARRTLPGGHPVAADLEQIQEAGRRGARLTQQLLSFARRQPVEPTLVEVDRAAAEMEGMLRRLLGERVTLRARSAPGLPPVRVDEGQFGQVLLNLVVNARDAMPEGGVVEVEIRSVEVTAGEADLHPESRSGPHVVVTVSDTGVGIPPEVLPRIFEPFFTTRGRAQGTGLGLATCYGIVKQAGGHIRVDSRPGHGSRFHVYLPAVVEAQVEPQAPGWFGAESAPTVESHPSPPRDVPLGEGKPRAQDPPPGEGGSPAPELPPGLRILLVEDDGLIRELACRVLRERGALVLEAARGDEAMALAVEWAPSLDLLVTDVVLPGAGGADVARSFRELAPELAVLFISGYPEPPDGELPWEEFPPGGFLPKPFTPDELAGAVATVVELARVRREGSPREEAVERS